MSTTAEEHTDGYGAGSQAASISNAIVQLHRQRYGKGPTKAKTYLLDEVVLCVFEGSALRIEETLRDAGRGSTVDRVRRDFQAALSQEFQGLIEQATGRRVRAFMSQFDAEHDIGLEIFFLEP